MSQIKLSSEEIEADRAHEEKGRGVLFSKTDDAHSGQTLDFTEFKDFYVQGSDLDEREEAEKSRALWGDHGLQTKDFDFEELNMLGIQLKKMGRHSGAYDAFQRAAGLYSRSGKFPDLDEGLQKNLKNAELSIGIP